MVFGEALKKSLEKDPTQFDRVQILSKTNDPIVAATRKVLNAFKAEKK
jgi:fructose-bisphosphate aldolase class II